MTGTGSIPFRLGIAGAAGRMGRQLLAAAVDKGDSVSIAGAIEQTGHSWLGRDAGEAAGLGALDVPVVDDPEAAFGACDAILDFTAPVLSVRLAELASERRIIHVIGTTGLSDANLARIEVASTGTAIVRSGNMSLGVNLLIILARQVAAALGEEDWDAEIVEIHHGRKVDAPSGTALMLGEAVADGRGQSLADVADRGRDGHTGPRRKSAIGFAALRGGDVVGEHEVLFIGTGERITLRHVATERAIYARGALQAALWARGKPAGLYGMADVLGLGGRS